MAGKYKEISDQTRQNFIDAFWQLYEKKDINKIKVQEICDIAGYHRNTFYHYFTDIYDVLDQIENRIIDELIENSDEQMFLNKNGKTAVVFADIYNKNEKYLKILADDERNSGFPLKMKKVLRPFYEKIFLFSADSEKNSYVFEYRLAGTIALILDCFKTGETSSLEERITVIIELATTGKWPICSR